MPPKTPRYFSVSLNANKWKIHSTDVDGGIIIKLTVIKKRNDYKDYKEMTVIYFLRYEERERSSVFA